MTNILLITQHFPPEISGGTGRAYSLYKYLPENGINVFVVTVNSYGTLANEPNVFRCESFINWRKSPLFSLKRFLKYVSLLFSKTISNYTDWYWYFTAKRKVKQIIYDNNIELIYSTFPAMESIRLGYTSSKAHKIPFIVEFRDGLVFESVYGRQNRFKEQERKRIERKIAKTSDTIITIGNNLSKYFQKTYSGSMVKTVFNGYDKDDFIKANIKKKSSDSDIIKIAFWGSIALSRKRSDSPNLFIATDLLYKERLIAEDKFQLHFIGRYSEDEKLKILEYNKGGSIFFRDVMPKDDGLAYIKENFDYLLILGLPGLTTGISSKLSEYLYLGLPVIGICKENEAADIIEQTGTGEVCDFDLDSIKKILLKALKREITYNPKHDEIAKFDREYQAKQIAQIIKNVLERK